MPLGMELTDGKGLKQTLMSNNTSGDDKCVEKDTAREGDSGMLGIKVPQQGDNHS